MGHSRTIMSPWTTLFIAVLVSCSSGDGEPTAPAPAHPINPIPDNLWRPIPPVTGNWVLIQSESGDWVGQGRRWVITPDSTPVFFPASTPPGVVMIAHPWQASLAPMQSLAQLEKGYYPNVGRFPSESHGGSDWGGDGRGCNEVSGWFAIDSIRYAGDTLMVLEVRAEQYCDGGTAPLHGAIHWRRPPPP
ncbi:MAG TPA: hypothetical protein PLI70_09895 [Gemmatimonadales bacterium]|nr:hypothetical protein [Gemmatimonadales bacterium]HRZ10729.1 hypothetical protein [Gemmatimonadales bacterium]